MRLTVTPGHAAGYLNKDSCVTEDHDGQRQKEEAHEGEHVVDGLLPALDEAAVGGALGEVLRDCDGHIVKYEHLHEKTTTVLLSNESKSVRQSGGVLFHLASNVSPVTWNSSKVHNNQGKIY